MSVRVRYAPSPTGSPHVGNIRDALFKHLFARHHGGVNILRIEDTDRTRFVPGCEDEIVESLNWLGIQFQEGITAGGDCGPYRQSERKELGIYEKWVQVLLERGHAYKAFDTPEELTEMREFQQVNKQPIGYFGGTWRDASAAQVEAAEAAGRPFVIRQRIPRSQTIVIQDFIRGRVEWDSDTVDDPVLIKADGMPTYHFAAMVDDHLMSITHIMRGEEWISSAPKHAMLFDQFEWERPVFVHCPVIKGKDGSKLSKRHGDTRVLDYRSAGYMPAALANFVALIGWSPKGDREILTMDELIEAFDLDGLQPSPGVFDLDKLRWMNGNAIRSADTGALVSQTVGFAQAPDTAEYWSREAHADGTLAALELLTETASRDPGLVREAIRLEQERVVTLADFGPACAFFFQDEPPMDDKAVEKWFGEAHVPVLIDFLIARFEGKSSVTTEECEVAIREFCTAHGFEKIGPAVHPTRVALTGKTAGPGLWDLMATLGPDRMVQRLRRAKGLVRA
ncbi:MAG: glutamate--tRNA ligase [Chthonomonas sp.]|nr:glutamate--tRNA ligase [Chthonomonas sp.]